jgi:CRP-like cAMP-binding protein
MVAGRATTNASGTEHFAMSTPELPRQNYLLAALSEDDYSRLLPHLEGIELVAGQVVAEFGLKQDYVYFPTSSLIALLWPMEDGTHFQTGLVGKDGMAGMGLRLGGLGIPGRAVVQTAGYGYRLAATGLKREFDRRGELQHLLLRFTQMLLLQIAQSALCREHHSIEQQLCRWLLLSLDGLPSDQLPLTQDSIADMSGGRRAGVTEAANRLQAGEVLQYRAGKITLDRPKLELRVCNCYSDGKVQFDGLLPRRQMTAPHPA